MKKVFPIIFASLLVSQGLTSCSQSYVNQNQETDMPEQTTETIVETEPSYLDTLGERDFEGASYAIAAAQQGTIPAYAVEQTGEIVNDALYERDLIVSEQYNVVIEYPETEDSPNTAINITNSVLAGDYYSDLYRDALSDSKSYMGYAFRQGALYNLLEIPYLQLDQSWWSELLYEKLQYNGKMFFTSGDIATASYYAPACVFMNVAVADNNDIDVDEIYQLVYEDAWTIDEMMKRTEGLRIDLNGDGVIKPVDDAYGVMSATVDLTATEICVGAGIRYCDIDEAGKLVVNLNTEQVVNTLDKLKQCFNEITPSDDWAPMNDAFMDDRALFLVHFVGTAIIFRDMESDFVILPMAKYNTEQETYMSYTNPHSHSYVAVPLIQPDIERTGFLTEVLEYLSVEMVRPTIYDVTLKGKISRDQNSQAMLDIIFNSSYIDFNALCMFGNSTAAVGKALFHGADFVSSYKKIENAINTSLEQFAAIFE